jgi:type I restriction enzyme, S subunit
MSRWPTVPLVEVCEINPRLSRFERPAPNAPVGFVPMSAVDEMHGEVAVVEARPFAAVSKGYTAFRDGDVLFAKITPCMENGKAAVVRSMPGGLGFGSTEFHVLRANGRVLPELIFHTVRQPAFRALAKANFTGTAGQQRVPTKFLERVRVPLPPLDEQRRIVDILNHAASIRRLREQARAKAKELIPALFLDMFGDPATNPKGWPVTAFGDLTTYSRYGPRFHDRLYASEGARILRTTDIARDGALRWRDSPRIEVTDAELDKYALSPNTLLFTRTGATIGKVALFSGASEPCIAGAYLIEFGLNPDLVPLYGWAFFDSDFGQRRLVGGSRSVAQPNINAPTIKGIEIAVPSKTLQQAFAERVAEIQATIDQMDRGAAEQLQAALMARLFDGAGA